MENSNKPKSNLQWDLKYLSATVKTVLKGILKDYEKVKIILTLSKCEHGHIQFNSMYLYSAFYN